MRITHSYLGVGLGGARYLFFLLYQDYLEAEATLSRELNVELQRFARNLKGFGAVVAPFAGDAEASRQHVLNKRWPADAAAMLRRTPALLMIDIDFDEFDPSRHRWAAIHLETGPDAASQTGALLGRLAAAINDGADPFELLAAAMREASIAKLADAIELKPGVFGLSVDLRHVWGTLRRILKDRTLGSGGSPEAK
jgi:hypothetical protein